jgi:flavodoxin
MMRHIPFVKNIISYVMITKTQLVRKSFFCLLITTLLVPGYIGAEESTEDKTLIVYYSRTGKTRLLCEVLQEHITSEILEVKPLDEDRYNPGRIGYYTAAFDSVFSRYIPIVPEQPDFSSYSSIIIVSPVWNWKLSAPIRTLIHNNQDKFDGKKMIFITNANEEVTKYEMYGDDAPFLKRYFRDFLRDKCEGMKSLLESSGCTINGYYHVATLEKTDEQIMDKTSSFIPDIKKALYGEVNMAKMIE